MPYPKAAPAPRTVPRGRCRCGHYPSQHMIVRPVEGSSNFRLDAGGPCVVCGSPNCAGYVPSATASSPP